MALKHVYYHVRNEVPVYRYRIQDAWGWCMGMIQRDDMGWEVGGGFRIESLYTPVVDSCQCMAKPIQYCKVISFQKIINKKASGGNGIPVELFQILKDDALKMFHSICQQIWKTQQWPQDWKRSLFIPIPKKDNAKEC